MYYRSDYSIEFFSKSIIQFATKIKKCYSNKQIEDKGERMEEKLIKIKTPLLAWYQENHRDLPWRKTSNPYYIWLSEIMLQQTRVEAVKDYYARFLEEIPDIAALASVSEEKLLKLWEGLGYYNRARNLQKAAKVVMEKYTGTFPSEYEQVIALPGIGEYTAGAICSICFDQPTPAVDGNVLRVMMRLLECYDNIDELKTKRKVRKQLIQVYEKGNCGELTQALMELGAVICIPKGTPKCNLCPFLEFCVANKHQTYDQLPVKKSKQKRRVEEKTVFVLHSGEEYGIRKRENKGLLANLWEFYHVEGNLDKQEALDFISEQGFKPVMLEKEVPYTHIFSHVEWRMKAYYIACEQKKQELLWKRKQELETTYALPTAFRVFLEHEE